MSCLDAAMMQGYLEELGPPPINGVVEGHLSTCRRCRDSFDHLAATNRRVNGWLAKLAPAELLVIDAKIALRRMEPGSRPILGGEIFRQRTNPRALVSSFVLQAGAVAALMLFGTVQAVRTPVSATALFVPPPPIRQIEHRSLQRDGGGHGSPSPPLHEQLVKPGPKIFHSPVPVVDHPALVMDESLIAPGDAWPASASPIGDPFGAFRGASGSGGKGGPGDGDGSGTGDRTGPGAGDGDRGIFAVGNGTSRPEVITKADPEYSEEARKAKYSGTVVLSIVVNADGTAADIKVVRSLGLGLDEKAVDAVRRWRFRPGMNKGVPVRVRAQIEVNFRLL